MTISPYLNFAGNCGEAFRFYHQVLGGKLEVMTFGDSPMSNDVPPDWADRVVHCCLTVDGQSLMASDSPPEHFEKAQGTYVTIGVKDTGEAERIWAAFSEGGQVVMPLEPTFWSPAFGMVKDRFGVPWMISTYSAKS